MPEHMADPGAMISKVLEDTLFLILSMYLIHCENYCIHLEPCPNTKTLDPEDMLFTMFEKTFFFIITMFLIHRVSSKKRRRRLSKN